MFLHRYIAAICLVASVFIFNSCDSDSENTPTPQFETGKITFEFDNIVGNKNLVLNSTQYFNASGEDFVVTKFNYFVSNFKLYKKDGTSFTYPQDSSYFLVKEDTKSSQFITLKDIPAGEYNEVEFIIGVDSLRNTAPLEKRTGVLNPAGDMASDGMYWQWNSGYIFLKLEGTSSFGNVTNDKFYYHIGLFGGYDNPTVNNVRTVRVKFGNDIATVNGTKTPEVHLFADLLKLFDNGENSLEIKKENSVMGNKQAVSQQIANNYQHMFRFDHVH